MPYGSVNNLIAGSSPTIVPVVGMGATQIGWTDRYPCTIVEVIDANTIVVQEDDYRRADKNGMSECQRYLFMPNPNAERVTVTRRKNGQWYEKGTSMARGRKFAIGSRDKYHDYSF